MLKEERFKFILEQLSIDQKVHLTALSELLKVSEDTIRRDLKELADQGLLKAVRGGAVPHSPTPHHFSDRLKYQTENKQRIARKALSLLQNGQIVIFDGGTSALAVAAILPQELKITVVTNSFPIATMLEEHPNSEVLFAGGRLYKNAFVTVGSATVRFFENIKADLCFMGICSIHPTLGVTTIHYEEGEVKKAMVEGSRQVVALAPSERLNTAESFYICPLNDLDTIITDSSPEDAAFEPFQKAGIRVL